MENVNECAHEMLAVKIVGLEGLECKIPYRRDLDAATIDNLAFQDFLP